MPLILFIYFVPTIYTFVRKNQFRWTVIYLNILIGWTGIGWIVALMLALQKDARVDTSHIYVPKPSVSHAPKEIIQEEAKHAAINAKPTSENSSIGSGQASKEFSAVLAEINTLKQVVSPELERVRELSRLLNRTALTDLQQGQIELILPQALEGKQVSWELKADNVSATSELLFMTNTPAGGSYIQHFEASSTTGGVNVECQTFTKGVHNLRRGQLVVISGRIARVEFLSVSMFTVFVADAIISQSSDDRTVLSETAEILPTKARTRLHGPSVELKCQTLHIDLPDSRAEPSYQTVSLTKYDGALRERAEEVFGSVSEQLGLKAKRYKGSFSVFSKLSNETVAKIVIYQHGLGRENGEWPSLSDGVYVLVRRNGGAWRATWEGNLLRSSALYERLNPERTLGIAPKHAERFAYFRLEPQDEIQSVADLLMIFASA
jgi:hypothetical protein